MKKVILSSLVAAVLLSGCGGGGGSSSSGSVASTPTAASIVITETNKTQVAAANIDAINAQSSGNTSALSFLPSGVEINTNAETNYLYTPLLLLQLVEKTGLISRSNADTNVPVGVVQEKIQKCNGGGEAIYNTNTTIYPVWFVRSGDYITITGKECSESYEGNQFYINGTMSLRVESAETSTTKITVNLDRYTISVDGVSLSGSGITESTMRGKFMSSIAETTQKSSGTFSYKLNGSARSRNLYNFTEVIRNGSYSLSGSFSNQGYKTRYSANGLAEFSKGNASVGAGTVTTLTTFETANGKTYPQSGQATIKGQKGTLRITAQSDATNVFIELDANDDGAYESTQTMTWAHLLASI